MTTITMDIDAATIARAEKKAASLDTSLGQVVADYLRQWAGDDQVQHARSLMMKKFASADWQFGVGAPDCREQRNARS